MGSRRNDSRRYRRVTGAVLAACTVLLAACGGGGGGGTTAVKRVTNGALDVSAYDPFRFDVKTIDAPAGKLTITLHERGSTDHTFTIPALHFEIKVSANTPSATGTATLVAGQTYSFKCSFDGHAAAGMTGKIVVTG